MDELDKFHKQVEAALVDISVMSITNRTPDVVLAVACEAFALAVRMTSPPAVIKLIDVEFARSLMKFSKLLLKPRRQLSEPERPKTGDPTGAKLISDALSQPPIPDDKKR